MCLEILCITGEQGLVCIKPKVIGWDQLGSSELKEEMCGYLIVRQLSNVQKEQLGMASPAEREMREMLMRTGGDDPDERSKQGVPRQQDLTQQQPPPPVSAAKTAATITASAAKTSTKRGSKATAVSSTRTTSEAGGAKTGTSTSATRVQTESGTTADTTTETTSSSAR